MTNLTKGIIVANVYVRGIKTEVIIDDYLYLYWPSAATSNRFAGTAPDGALYVPFLEKIFAKVSSTFEAIEAGNQPEAQAFLVAAPTDSFYYANSPYTGMDAWINLNASHSVGYMSSFATTSSCGGDTSANAFGIPCSHAFTHLGTYVLHDSSGVADYVFKVRNPWGSADSFNSNAGNTYSGKWYDGDPLWSTIVAPDII
jgi:hypothetical protein